MAITQTFLRSVLEYGPETGDFYWIKPPWNHANLRGRKAGCDSTGYTLIKIGGQRYKAHRLAWLYVYGVWPRRRIDHRDGNPRNNAIANLREATPTQNCANAARKEGKSEPKGVRQLPSGKFQARIRVNHQLHTIGSFDDVEAAAAAYLAEARRHFGEFARAA